MRRILLSIFLISVLMTGLAFAKFTQDHRSYSSYNFGQCRFGNCTTTASTPPSTSEGQMQFLGDDMAFNGDSMVYNP